MKLSWVAEGRAQISSWSSIWRERPMYLLHILRSAADVVCIVSLDLKSSKFEHFVWKIPAQRHHHSSPCPLTPSLFNVRPIYDSKQIIHIICFDCTRAWESQKSNFHPNRQFLTNSPATSISAAPPPNTVLAMTRAKLSVRLCVEQKLQLGEVQKPPVAASRPLRVKKCISACLNFLWLQKQQDINSLCCYCY